MFWHGNDNLAAGQGQQLKVFRPMFTIHTVATFLSTSLGFSFINQLD